MISAALPPLAAETIYRLGGLPVTNTFINALIATLGIGFLAFFLRRSSVRQSAADSAPRGFLNFFESIIEFCLQYVDQVTRSRRNSLRFLPLAGSLFLFILISNWMGLIPGTGSVGIWEEHNGNALLVPLFRPANTDLNLTLAMAIVAVVSSHLVGIFSLGFFSHAGKYIKLAGVWRALKSFNPMKLLTAIIEIFVGFIEIFSEIAKMVSLSLRLFGNIFAGEVLLTVLASLVAYFIPLPFMALELLVGFIQAVVFSMLTLVYLNLATIEEHSSH